MNEESSRNVQTETNFSHVREAERNRNAIPYGFPLSPLERNVYRAAQYGFRIQPFLETNRRANFSHSATSVIIN